MDLGSTADTAPLLDLGRRLDAVTGVRTHVLVLDTTTLRVAGPVLREGRLFFSVDEVARVRYEATTRKLAADFANHVDALDRKHEAHRRRSPIPSRRSAG